MPFGKIEVFEVGSHNWDAYCRRIQQFIALNNIEERLHVATLVTHVGVTCYELMCDLCSPDMPEDKTFKDLIKIVKDHLEPQRSEIAERHMFRQRKQQVEENVSEYLKSLKHLAKTCNFSNTLEVNIRDQFVSGLKSEDMRSRLFAERNIDYKRAVELALALEAADRHAAAAVSGGSGVELSAEGLHSVSAARTDRQRGAAAGAGPRASCGRCGRGGHAAARCRFKQYTCDNCGQKGHLKVMCKKVLSEVNRESNKKGQILFNQSYDSDSGMYNYFCDDNGDRPYSIAIEVNSNIIKFEIDTGSKISAISKICYDNYFANIVIENKSIKLRSYTGNIIEPLGYIWVNVKYGSVTRRLQLFIIENGGPPLMGRTWIRCLNLNLNNMHYLLNQGIDNRFQMLKKEFADVFAIGLGTCKTRIHLELNDKTPVFVKARPLPLALRAPVESELERLQKEGVIYKVDRSDFGSPIVPIIKKNGDIRICGDYKITINPRLKDFHYPLPRIEEIFYSLGGGEHFSKLDLSHAYQQCLLTKESQPMTAITTHVGTFVYNRVPFGIKCIPENFQKIMEETLAGLPSTVVFQDDICVTGKDRETHLKNLHSVLSRLKEAGLRVNYSKCEFFKNSVTYLGYKIDREGLHTDKQKIEAINLAPQPRDVTQLKSFLGLVNFYSKFCVNMSGVLKPLYDLLRKDAKWNWDNRCDYAFNKIKRLLCSSPILAHYTPELPLVLSVDSSAYGLGAVLAQRYPDGSERPLSCASRTLSDAERNYSQLDKEALAIMYGVQKHHQYLYGRHFTLRSDHRPLSYIFGKNKGIPQTAASRLQRYAVRLAAYDFDIEYISSAKNCFADTLSRLPLNNLSTGHNTALSNNSYLNFIEDKFPLTFNEVKTETNKDATLNKILSFVKFGWPQACTNNDYKQFFLRQDRIFVEHGCLVWGYRVIIPTKLQSTVLRELHSGHIGVVKMKQLARNYVWWAGLDADIERMCRECAACNSQRANPPPAPLHTWEWPTEPWVRLNIVYLGPYRNNYYVILIDAHSKWLEVEKVPNTSAKVLISFLRKVFCRFGLPRRIVSDNGPPFSSSEYLSYLNKNGIKRILVSPYHPSSNGAAENAVKTVKQVLKKATFENEDYEVALSRFLFTYRNSEHCTTQKEPAVALLGRRLRSRLDLLRPDTKDIVNSKQALQEDKHRGRMRVMQPGDKVLARNYCGKGIKWKEGIVVEKTGPVSYVVKTLDDSRNCRRHIDQIINSNNSRKSRYSMSCTQDPAEKDIISLEDNTVGTAFEKSRSSTPIFLSPKNDSNSSLLSEPDVNTKPRFPLNEDVEQLSDTDKLESGHRMVLRPRKEKYQKKIYKL